MSLLRCHLKLTVPAVYPRPIHNQFQNKQCYQCMFVMKCWKVLFFNYIKYIYILVIVCVIHLVIRLCVFHGYSDVAQLWSWSWDCNPYHLTAGQSNLLDRVRRVLHPNKVFCLKLTTSQLKREDQLLLLSSFH